MLKRDELEALAKGEGCLARSADDEPIFILCGRDVLAAARIREWADELEKHAHLQGELTAQRKDKIYKARVLANEMDAWRASHGGGKLPD